MVSLKRVAAVAAVSMIGLSACAGTERPPGGAGRDQER